MFQVSQIRNKVSKHNNKISKTIFESEQIFVVFSISSLSLFPTHTLTVHTVHPTKPHLFDHISDRRRSPGNAQPLTSLLQA